MTITFRYSRAPAKYNTINNRSTVQYNTDNRMCRFGLPHRCNVSHKINVEQYENQLLQRGRRRRRRRRQSQRQLSFQKTVLLLIASTCILQRSCNGSDPSSFRRNPPPPPPPPLSRGFNNIDDNNYGQNSNGIIDDNNYNTQQQQQQQQQAQHHPDEYGYYGNSGGPPPPPPQSATDFPSSSLPIHYEFPITATNDDKGKGKDAEGKRIRKTVSDDDDDDDTGNFKSTSARTDLVTRYWSKKIGKVQIQTIIGLIGYGSGSFVAKSLVGESDVVQWTGCFWAFCLVVSTWFRTPIGELSRALGLSLILVLQRTQQIRRDYPTWRYVGASMGIGVGGGGRDARGRPIPRRGPRPFPPTRNPWKYVPRSSRDPDFNMIYALIIMGMVGSTVGGNMPFIPSWIGALVGASSFAFACTWQDSPRGDLARSCAMRIVAACTELWKIQADLQIIPKATVVSSQIIDKAMILDRKHSVKDKFLSFANKGYESASKVAEQIQQQQRNRGGPDNKDTSKENRRDDDDDRRKNVDDRDRRYRKDKEPSDDDEDYSRSRRREEGNRRRDSEEENERKYDGNSRSTRRGNDDDDDRFGRRNNSDERRSDDRNYDDRENYRRNSRDDTSYNDEEPEKKSKGFFGRRK